MSEKQRQTSKAGDWYNATLIGDDKPSRLSAVVYFALLALAVFAVLAYGAVDVGTLGLTALFAGLIGILWLLDSWLKGEFLFSDSLLQVPLLGLIIIGLIQLLPVRSADVSKDLLDAPISQTLSFAPSLTRFALIQLIVYLIFFAAALTFIGNQKRLRKTVFATIIFGGLAAFLGILQRLAGVDGIYGIRRTADAVTFASYVNQHHFAALMEMTIGLTLSVLFTRKLGKEKRILLAAAAVVMGMAILFTGSRGGLISLVAVVAFVGAANFLGNRRSREKNTEETKNKSRFPRKLTYIVGGLALILGLLGAVILLGGDESLVRGFNLTADQTDATNGRKYFWQTAFKIIFDHPIIGTGLDSFGVVFTRYDSWNGNLRVEQAHNDYIQILADAGILGFACVASFIILLFKQSLQIITKASDNFRRSVAAGALAGCVGILIHSLFDFPLRTPANGYFFLLLAVLATASISYPKLYRNKKMDNG